MGEANPINICCRDAAATLPLQIYDMRLIRETMYECGQEVTDKPSNGDSAYVMNVNDKIDRLTHNISIIHMPRLSSIGGVDPIDGILEAIALVQTELDPP
ncbi:MAG: hypothetical protein FRX49_08862 [Trebouxia sp. A1-2]|nr:MAG: hypothetical protein FRX49_08862 [Trebouxia sp. A1-2]